MRKTLACLAVVLFLFGCSSILARITAPAEEKGSWTGWLTDDGCGGKKGFNNPEHASCVIKCISRGDKAALAVAEDKLIILDIAREKAEEFAGAHVKVSGALNKKKNTIKVDIIEKVN